MGYNCEIPRFGIMGTEVSMYVKIRPYVLLEITDVAYTLHYVIRPNSVQG
jgi:hypothetical protein